MPVIDIYLLNCALRESKRGRREERGIEGGIKREIEDMT